MLLYFIKIFVKISIFNDNMVSFLLGCSFSFENAMLAAGLPARNMEEGKNVVLQADLRHLAETCL
jgi:uncharacterized protein YcsI (UPF0317 family)